MRPRRSSAQRCGGGAHPSACPYGQRVWVEAPHPFITRPRLHEALAPAANETILEVGPGTGYYTLSVAEGLGGVGALHIFDPQQEMLDHTVRRAAAAGISNLQPLRGDAPSLPYATPMFDAAYLVAVLGEIPDQRPALSELRRVLKSSGRLVVGELFGDPHTVTAGSLRRVGADAGVEPSVASGRGSATSACCVDHPRSRNTHPLDVGLRP